ncbi:MULTISPECIES: hypothetical protein [unclassified Campylobacter]|uniref:hypothetical protein n=1 Tax=unclassified Campylobacter TaxID=2593542 RepID=UPI003D352ABD
MQSNEIKNIDGREQNYKEYEITQADKKDMREILAQRERGELEYISETEFKQYMEKRLANLGVKL